MRLQLLLSLFLLSHWQARSLVQAFTFTFGTPTQCDDLILSWTGGQAPYQATLIPVFGTPRNVSIPSSAFSNGQGSYKTQLPFKKDQNILIMMSDATGFATGGVTKALTVGASINNSNCNTTDPGVAFPFELDTALQQCRAYTFSAYTAAAQPVVITGFVPGGETFFLYPPVGPTSFDWIADVAAGTSIVFLMTDAQGRTGGSSDIETVGITDDQTCLNAASPSSTANPPSASTSASSSSSTSGSAPTSTGSSSSSPSAGDITGAVIGGLLAVAAVISFVIFCIKKRQNRQSVFPRRHSRRLDSIDLSPDPISYVHPYPYTPNNTHMAVRTGDSTRGSYDPAGPNLPPTPAYDSTPHASLLPTSSATEDCPPATTASYSASSSSGRRKQAMAGMPSYARASRFVLHTDAEEVMPDENGVVELPPMYSEARKPIPGLVPVPEQSALGETSSSHSPPRISGETSPHLPSPHSPGLQPPPS